jgi:hypothetical protein
MSNSLACTTDADCCLVFDQCYAKLYLVAKADVDAAKACFSTKNTFYCTSCCPPVVETWCQNGQCVAGTVPGGCGTPHCGRLSAQGSGGTVGSSQHRPAADASISTGGTSFGCNGV